MTSGSSGSSGNSCSNSSGGNEASAAADKLVKMAKGQEVTYKIAKRTDELLDIEKLPGWINASVPE